MTLLQLTEPLFQHVCRLNRVARRGGPAKPAGGFVGPMPVAGAHGFFTATLAAGKYVFLCFVPDQKDGKPHVAHGMLKEVTVS